MKNRAMFVSIFAVVAALMLIPGSAIAKVIIKEKTVYYTVAGKDGAAINRHMISRGSRTTKLYHAIAATQTDIKIGKVTIIVEGKRCIVKDVDVVLSLKYTLPHWRYRNTASKRLGSAWDDFYKKLVSHEKTHGKIAKDAAYSMEKEIKRFKGNISRDCSDFGRFSEFRFAKIVGDLSRRQISFDLREAFGFSAIARSQKILFETN